METSTSEEFGSGFELIDIDMYYEDYADIAPCFPDGTGDLGMTEGAGATTGAGTEAAGAGAGTEAAGGVAGFTAGAEAGAWTGAARAVLDVSALISASVVFGPGRPSAGVILRFF